jgi:dihydroorotase
MTRLSRSIASCCAALSLAAVSVTGLAQHHVAPLPAAPPNIAYDLILQNGHVIDDKNHIDSVMDVAIKDGKIAKVADHIASSDALKTIDVKGLYVTPGLIDLHFHAYAGTGERGSYAGDNSIYPDGFTFRTGVTTVIDAGCSGWRNFEDYKQRIIDRSRTRILVMLNIVGSGMRGDKYEQNTADMDGEATAKKALEYPGLVVGIKTAHFAGPEWKPVEQAVIAGTKANIPVMVDFGVDRPTRPLYDLLNKKLRPGDIYTHMYSGLRQEQDPVTKGPSKAFIDGRKRGIIFDLGTGGGSFKFSLAVPMVKDGFIPDSISTDLHIGSMNSATHDELNVASKMMAVGLNLQQVIAEMTSHPAREIKHEELGNLSVGSIADVAVLKLTDGNFGFTDMVNGRLDGTKLLSAEITIKDGRIVYDLNGREALPWDAPADPNAAYAARWTTFAPRGPDMHGTQPSTPGTPADNNRH